MRGRRALRRELVMMFAICLPCCRRLLLLLMPRLSPLVIADAADFDACQPFDAHAAFAD